jgi:hypothetical protein
MKLLRWAVTSIVIVGLALFNMVLVYAVFNQVSVVSWFPSWSVATFFTTIIVLWLAEK